MTNRFVDYLVIVGADPQFQLEPSSAKIQAKGVNVAKLQFKTAIVDRYPQHDYQEDRLSLELPLFCLPHGATAVHKDCPLPHFFTLALTGGDGARTYVACFSYFDLLTEQEYDKLSSILQGIFLTSNTSLAAPLNPNGSNDSGGEMGPAMMQVNLELPKPLYVSKCLCIVSHYPFFSAYKAFLMELYRTSLTPSKIPVERLITNFVMEVPLPPRGRVQVEYALSEGTISLRRPAPNELPLFDLPLENVFHALSVQNVLLLFNYLLLECKILVYSKHFSMLNTVIESMNTLLFPFRWQHVYIPLLPERCVEFTSAPVPFLMGMHSSFVELAEIPPEVIVVDIDNDCIICHRKDLPPLPDRQATKLQQGINRIFQKINFTRRKLDTVDIAFDLAPRPDETRDIKEMGGVFPTLAIRELFFRFFVSLLQRYRSCLAKPVNIANAEFDQVFEKYFRKTQFLKEQSNQAQPFLKIFFTTQCFTRFLYDKLKNPEDTEVLLFDESILAKTNRSKLTIYKKETPFLNDQSAKISNTIITLTPDISGLQELKSLFNASNGLFFSPTISKLNPMLIPTPRAIKHLVSQSDVKSAESSRILHSWKTIITTLCAIQASLVHHHANKKHTGGRTTKQLASSATPVQKLSVDSGNHHIASPSKQQQKPSATEPNNKGHGHSRSISIGDYEIDIGVTADNDLSSLSTISFAGAPLQLLQESDDSEGSESTDTPRSSEQQSVSNLFSRLCFETTETCPNPKCHHIMHDSEIRMGWSLSNAHEYRTSCSKCETKFVPRFSVLFDSLHCSGKRKQQQQKQAVKPTSLARYEYLSPLVLKKEVENLVAKDVAADTNLFRNHPLVFWNLILHMRDLMIPLNFLLPQVRWEEMASSLVRKMSEQSCNDEEIQQQPASPVDSRKPSMDYTSMQDVKL